MYLATLVINNQPLGTVPEAVPHLCTLQSFPVCSHLLLVFLPPRLSSYSILIFNRANLLQQQSPHQPPPFMLYDLPSLLSCPLLKTPLLARIGELYSWINGFQLDARMSQNALSHGDLMQVTSILSYLKPQAGWLAASSLRASMVLLPPSA